MKRLSEIINNRRSNTIKTKTLRFVRVNFVIYVLVGIIVLFVGFAAAQMMKTAQLESKLIAIQVQQDRLAAQIEGQALSQERTDIMALTYTGRVFSIDRYRQWAKATYGGNAIPDWPRACNGQPVYKENNKDTWVRGLDGEYRPCAPEWEAPAPAACLRTQRA